MIAATLQCGIFKGGIHLYVSIERVTWRHVNRPFFDCTDLSRKPNRLLRRIRIFDKDIAHFKSSENILFHELPKSDISIPLKKPHRVFPQGVSAFPLMPISGESSGIFPSLVGIYHRIEQRQSCLRERIKIYV